MMNTNDEGQRLLAQLAGEFQLSGNLSQDSTRFLMMHDQRATAGHCRQVATEAKALALRFGADPVAAEAAGLLHDISAVVPNTARIAAANVWNVPVLAEEASFPMIIHQKLSVVIAREVFGIEDEPTLSAIGCHTTLKAHASLLDKVVFLADKIRWDQPGTPPYLAAMEHALTTSLNDGLFVYLDYLWQRRATLRVVHPWLVAAYAEFTKG